MPGNFTRPSGQRRREMLTCLPRYGQVPASFAGQEEDQHMRTVILMLLTAIVLATTPVVAQTCDDLNACTTPDMCSNGECNGTPITGGTCDDFNVCTGPDTCVAGICQGAPLNGGTCDDGN